MKRFSILVKTSLLFAITSIITLLIGEFLIRIILPQDKMVTWIEMHEDGFVMNQSGGTAFQELEERKAFYRFNKERLRGNEIKPNKVNILTLGDSFTFGLLLDEEDTYLQRLQKKADEVFPDSIQFLNAAVGGSGLADWPVWLENFGEATKPNFILYFMNYDDVNRALSKNLFIIDEEYPDSLIKSQRWIPKSFLTKLSTKNSYRWLQANSELFNILVKVFWKHFYFDDLTYDFNPDKSQVPIPSISSFAEDSEYSTKLARSLIDKMEDWCNQKGCEFIVINTGFFEDDNMSSFDQKFYESIQKSNQNLSVEYLDNTECVKFRAHSNLDEFKIPGDSHPNEKGAKIIAECSWEKLQPFLFP
ncbi:MAG: SGNH/GDSL hydrolase family protein [Balneolaceae bacterium]